MMNTRHLLWIIPLVASIGFVKAALLAANGRDEES